MSPLTSSAMTLLAVGQPLQRIERPIPVPGEDAAQPEAPAAGPTPGEAHA